MTDTPNQTSPPTAVNQKLVACPVCGADIIARVYMTVMADTDVAYHDNSFTVNVVGLSVGHDCSPRAHRRSE